MRAILVLAALLVSLTPSQAKVHRHKHVKHPAHVSVARGEIVSHPAGCPGRAFCGCGVSVKVFGHPVRSLYLASNWFKFPRTTAASGMVAVRNHHVMFIERVNANGEALVYDPNSGGHLTRLHTRSLAGYVVVNPQGALHRETRMASDRHVHRPHRGSAGREYAIASSPLRDYQY